MLLADLGAEVVRIEREAAMGGQTPSSIGVRAPIVVDISFRGREKPGSRGGCKADALIEGFRPGVMERLDSDRNPFLPLISPSVRAGDRLGAIRASFTGCRTRYQLHLIDGRARWRP